jgi:hypothetical protein
MIDPSGDVFTFADEVFFYEHGLLFYAEQNGHFDPNQGAIQWEAVCDP